MTVRRAPLGRRLPCRWPAGRTLAPVITRPGPMIGAVAGETVVAIAPITARARAGAGPIVAAILGTTGAVVRAGRTGAPGRPILAIPT